MKKVWLVRHGESKAQTDEEWSFDANLSDLGIKQSRSLTEILSLVDFDCIYLSPLRRARQTFQESGITGKKVIFDSRLIEIMPVSAYQVMWPYEELPDYGEEADYDGWHHEWWDRLKDFYQDLLKTPGTEILVISHAGVAEKLMILALDGDFNDLDKESYFEECGMGNAGISILELYSANDQPNGLLLWNYREHVEELGKSKVPLPFDNLTEDPKA